MLFEDSRFRKPTVAGFCVFLRMMNCEEVISSVWSELPQDLLGLITDKLSSFSLPEYIRFGSVCMEWRSFSIQYCEYIKLPSNLPVLLIPNSSSSSPLSSSTTEDECAVVSYFNPKHIWQGQNAKQRYKSTRSFYSLYEKKVYHEFPLPIPYYKNIRGSSHGWLVTVEECYRDDNGEACYPVRLLNPFRTADNINEIQLPPLIHGNPGNIKKREVPFHSYYLQKVHLSANPSSLSDLTKLVVLAVYGQYNLGFCRPGDKSWTTLDVYKPVFDIICCSGQFYAVLESGYVFSFVLDDDAKPIVKLEQAPPKEENFRQLPKGCPRPNKRYLVESAGGYLLQVRRDVITTYFPQASYVTTGFKVFRLELEYESGGGRWVEMKTLDDSMLFLGTSGSISLPVFHGCKPNSIYFTDEENWGFGSSVTPHDIGVFNLEDGSIEPLYKLESSGIMPPPIWIQPML